MQKDARDQWVKEPKYPTWGFENPLPHLVKVKIDGRPSMPATQFPLPDRPGGLAKRSGNLVFPSSSQLPPFGEGFPPPFPKKENQRPGWSSEKDYTPFVGDSLNPQSGYFGGPIFDKSALQWRNTLFVRGNEHILGADENAVPLPSNMAQLIRSVGVMCGSFPKATSQSCIWVGPRLLLSTLHFNSWLATFPTADECDVFVKSRTLFRVENEISMQLLGPYSPTVELVSYSVDNDVGLFRLTDRLPDREDFIDHRYLIERDEVYQQQLPPACKAACIGYSGPVPKDEANLIIQQAAYDVHRQVPGAHFPLSPINLDDIIKPEVKSVAPGTIDRADVGVNTALFGVSASLWKGSSGGPCVLLEGAAAGGILGLVRGYDLYSDPYHFINGFPNGLRDHINALL